MLIALQGTALLLNGMQDAARSAPNLLQASTPLLAHRRCHPTAAAVARGTPLLLLPGFLRSWK